MTIQKATTLYEVLIRFGADGTVKGAHQQSIERITDGEAVLSERQLNPETVDPAALGELLGKNTAEMLAQIDSLTKAVAQRDTAIEAAESEIARLTALIPVAPQGAIHIAWLKLALEEVGKLDDVDAAVAHAGRAYQILWDYATTIRRTDPEVVAIGAALDLDLDAVFARAEELRKARASVPQ